MSGNPSSLLPYSYHNSSSFSFTEQSIEHLVVNSVLNFLGKVDVRYVELCAINIFSLGLPVVLLILCGFSDSSDTYLLHYELLNFMLVALSTQLLSGPSLGADDIHPFFDAAMSQVIIGFSQ